MKKDIKEKKEIPFKNKTLIFNPDSKKERYQVKEISNGIEKLTTYEGVTGILGVIAKPYLYSWYSKEMAKELEYKIREGKKLTLSDIKEGMLAYTKVRDNALDKGKIAHRYMELYIQHSMLLDKLPNDVKTMSLEQYIEKEEKQYSWAQFEEVRHIWERFMKWCEENVSEFLDCERPVVSEKYGYAGTFDFLAKDKEGKIFLGDFKTSNQLNDEYQLQAVAYMNAIYEMEGIRPEYAVIVRSDKMTDKEVKEYNQTTYKWNKKGFEIDTKWNSEDNFKMFYGALLIKKTGRLDFDLEKDIREFCERLGEIK